MYNTRKLAFTKRKNPCYKHLNPPVKHAGLVPVRLKKLINKTLTTDNWHREHGRSTEVKQKERTATTGRSRPESPK